MGLRLITVLVAALALLPATAFAQEPTATPGPPDSASDAVKLIYEDYRRDGKIDVCEHERADLEDALDTIEPDFDTDYPDFREAIEAGIQRHDNGRCDATATPTATATATATASATATATASPDDGTLPPPDDDSGGTDDGAIPPTDDGTGTPEDGTLPPEATATVAPSVTPVPTVAPATTPLPSVTPGLVSTKADSSKLLIPGVLVALAFIGALALLIFGRNSPAWREAAFRTRTTWADFTDWLRLGR
ncbi:hypothetical protein OJ997_19135 [Solirubrobacter phytolaccae]|uniref:Uncharacterized protein n=1 Tax=Solirubrobacter phytolaccae TaxID=1404360 RepID=A0A9X3NAJ5_9ACTN|nr:hypothetical protein [Solirubrobacter phytolaccae]MDA0182431.1 hypothetical protein [Solirubrobacter phytolaccae]